jgi:hypothetical protein
LSGELARKCAGRSIPGAERAADAIEHTPFDLVDDRRRQAGKRKRLTVSGKAIRKHSDTSMPSFTLPLPPS